jgi:hypothetical protein
VNHNQCQIEAKLLLRLRFVGCNLTLSVVPTVYWHVASSQNTLETDSPWQQENTPHQHLNSRAQESSACHQVSFFVACYNQFFIVAFTNGLLLYHSESGMAIGLNSEAEYINRRQNAAKS